MYHSYQKSIASQVNNQKFFTNDTSNTEVIYPINTIDIRPESYNYHSEIMFEFGLILNDKNIDLKDKNKVRKYEKAMRSYELYILKEVGMLIGGKLFIKRTVDIIDALSRTEKILAKIDVNNTNVNLSKAIDLLRKQIKLKMDTINVELLKGALDVKESLCKVNGIPCRKLSNVLKYDLRNQQLLSNPGNGMNRVMLGIENISIAKKLINSNLCPPDVKNTLEDLVGINIKFNIRPGLLILAMQFSIIIAACSLITGIVLSVIYAIPAIFVPFFVIIVFVPFIFK
jgi:hypothetical protein